MAEFKLVYDQTAQRFRGSGGRFVAEPAVRAAVDDLVQTAGDRMATLTGRLTAGGPLADWQSGMRAELKGLHTVLATVAHGGKAQMSPSDYGWVSGRLREQYTFLSQFSLDLAQGRLTPAQAAARAQLYAESGRLTWAEMRHRDARLRGAGEERWVRRASESCPGCVAQSARGWVAVGQLPRLGSQPCRSRCKCEIQTRPVAQAAA